MPKPINPEMKEIIVSETGFILLQKSQYTKESIRTDEIEWGWRLVIENRGEIVAYACAGYSLLDQQGFVLASAGDKTCKKGADIIRLNPGDKKTLQGRSYWEVNSESKPYPAKRIANGDYWLKLSTFGIDCE